MIKIRMFKGNDVKSFMEYESPVIPPIGELLWIKGEGIYYKVTGINHVICTKRKRLEIELIVS